MNYCKRCLYPENHPLNITFDDQGVCSGCRVHEEKDELDWVERARLLEDILGRFRNTSGIGYDCIIPVSGARDSYFIVDTVKNVYGMRPLLVTYNKHYNTNRGIRNLAYLRTIFDCDLTEMTLGVDLLKRITRQTVKRLGSMYWHCLAGQTVFPVQMAARLKVPLIVWGAHQGCDQVGMFSHLDEVEMTRKYRKDHDLMGVEAEDLVDESEGIAESDMVPFSYPHDKEIEKVGVRGIYLSNYVRWDSKAQHERMIDRYGYESAPQQRTFDTYNDVDCIHYSGLHDHLKFLKHGYGKVTDHASREIRLKRLTREEGIDLVKTYQDREPEDLPEFLKWIEMTEKEFSDCVDAHRDPRVWAKTESGRWELLDSVIEHGNDAGVDAVRLRKTEDCDFAVTPSKDPNAVEDRYVLMARGWVDGWTVPDNNGAVMAVDLMEAREGLGHR